MEFIQRVSADSIIRFFKLHPIEITLISLATFITILSFVLQAKQNTQSAEVLSARISTNKSPEESSLQPTTNFQPPTSIFVEVSGAIIEPDVYEVSPGTRLGEVIERAGGLSATADALYVARNYNRAKFVGDQEKIYIPYTWDIIDGIFVEQKRILEYLQPLYSTNASNPVTVADGAKAPSSALTISINEAAKEELETLPGVGPVTAQKMIDSRPYLSTDELLTKKVINNATLEKIKAHIEL